MKVVNKGVCFLGFNNYIVNISLDKVVFYLVFEAGLYGALVGSPGVLEPEAPKGVMKDVLIWSSFLRAIW